MIAIEIKALTKRYGSARGVGSLSFDVEEGEIFGTLNPNRTRINRIPKYGREPTSIWTLKP